jgi:hypothetical protein
LIKLREEIASLRLENQRLREIIGSVSPSRLCHPHPEQVGEP